MYVKCLRRSSLLFLMQNLLKKNLKKVHSFLKIKFKKINHGQITEPLWMYFLIYKMKAKTWSLMFLPAPHYTVSGQTLFLGLKNSLTCYRIWYFCHFSQWIARDIRENVNQALRYERCHESIFKWKLALYPLACLYPFATLTTIKVVTFGPAAAALSERQRLGWWGQQARPL